MLDRVARLTGRSTLSTCSGNPARWDSFVPIVNGLCRAILASQGEINQENMAVRGEFVLQSPFVSVIC